MTREEAILFFGGDEDELLDGYENLLFSYKNYFLTKPVISKLYFSQFKKMELLREAAEKLEMKIESKENDQPDLFFSNCIIADFQLYEKRKAEVKMMILNSASVDELKHAAGMMLKLQAGYIDLWPDLASVDLDEVVISKEPDPMELLQDLKELSKQGVDRFEQLKISLCETHVTVFNEWKRLSLLRNKELEWKKISSVN
jgi:hypothetical protein